MLKLSITLFVISFLIFISFLIRKKGIHNTKVITYGALAMALAFLLSYIKLRLPNGGSITPGSMMPIFIFSYWTGPVVGIFVGFCYGILQLVQTPLITHWAQVFLDYPIAFSMLGFSAFFKDKLYLGIIVGGGLRLFSHVISGSLFFSSYVPKGENIYLYSLIYNMIYLVPDISICVFISFIPGFRNIINQGRSKL